VKWAALLKPEEKEKPASLVGTRVDVKTTSIAGNPIGTGKAVYLLAQLRVDDTTMVLYGADITYTQP